MNKRGFTLVELMVVVAIIAFLASLALPAYFKYLAKAKQAEVAINLASLHTAEQMYFSENSKYSSNLSDLGWKPGSNVFYTYGFIGSDSKNFFVGKLKTPGEHLKNTLASRGNFLAAAVGDIAGSGKLDIWTVDENRNIKHVQNGLE